MKGTNNNHSVTGADLLRQIRLLTHILVKSFSNLHSIETYRRKWGKLYYVYDDADIELNGFYYLKFEKSSTILSDNENWEKYTGGAVMDIYTAPHSQFPIDYLIKIQDDIPTTITELPRPDGIIFSGGVTWLTGLTVLVGVHAYYINGVFYTSNETELTFAEAHATLPRIDLIVVNSTGETEIVQGTPDANPQKPGIDPGSEREVTFKLIAAEQTDLGDGILIIYNENTEFTGSANYINAVFDAATQPYDGTYHIDIQGIDNNNHFTLTDSSTHQFSDYIDITFFIWLKAVMTNQESLYMVFLKNEIEVSDRHLVPVNKSRTGQYQLVGINLSDMQLYDAEFDAVRFEWNKQGAQTTYLGFYMDLVRMEADFVPPVITTDHNLLSNLQGGSADERYHLSKPKHDTVQKIGEAENLPTWNGDAWPGTGSSSGFLYIAYASDDIGTDFTLTFNPALKFIAILYSETEIETPVVGDFTGKWVKYIGDDGEDGDPGDSAFVYIAYASDDAGTGFTTTFDPALNYIAIKSTTTEIATPVVGDFTGLWKNYKGADGEGGGGTATPSYNPIDIVEYYEDGKVKQLKTDIGESKFIDKRVAYHESGDNIGKADFAEIKDESTDPALWKKIQYNYTEKVLTSTTVTDIVAWTIII